MSKEQPENAIEVIQGKTGTKVFGEPVKDKLGNSALVHESSVPESEGGPLVWLTLQKAGETEGVGVLLDQAQLQDLQDRLDAAKGVWG